MGPKNVVARNMLAMMNVCFMYGTCDDIHKTIAQLLLAFFS